MKMESATLFRHGLAAAKTIISCLPAHFTHLYGSSQYSASAFANQKWALYGRYETAWIERMGYALLQLGTMCVFTFCSSIVETDAGSSAYTSRSAKKSRNGVAEALTDSSS